MNMAVLITGVLFQALIAIFPAYIVFRKWQLIPTMSRSIRFYKLLSMLLFISCSGIALYGWFQVWSEYSSPTEWGMKANGLVLAMFAFISPIWSLLFSLPLVVFLYFKLGLFKNA
jgi:hypothetical protein